MENERLYQILLYCLEEDEMISQSTLAEHFQVSQSTIRLDVDKLEELVKQWNLTVIKKRGVGIKIDGHEKDKKKAKAVIHEQLTVSCGQQGDELEYGILLYLFQHLNTYVRITDLANEFYVSESAVQKRLKRIQERVHSNQINIKTVQNKGIMINGDEERVRKFLARLMTGFQQTKSQDLTSGGIQEQMLTMLGIQSQFIFYGIAACEQELNKAFSDEARNALAIHIAIAIKRSTQKKHVPCHEFIDRTPYEKEYMAAMHLFEYIMEHYGITYSEDEVYYLFLHLISAKVIEDKDLFIEVDRNMQDSVIQIAEEIAALVANVKQIHISQQHIDNLILHLRPMMNRLEYRIELENPLLNEIKSSFPEAYGLAWMCNTIVRRYVDRELSENEAGFVAMHIQAMIESNKKDVQIVIVCSSGVGVSQLLATQIEKHFSCIRIASVDSLATFHKHSYGKEIDLVLSTFPLKCDRPMLIVNSFLTNEDIQEIHHFIDHFHLRSHTTSNTLKVQTLLQQHWTTQQEVIHQVAKLLLSKKEVTETFEESVYAREKINSTAIGMQVALPHASFESILVTQLVIVTLQESILWGDDPVDFIMFVLVCDGDTQWANSELKKVYRKLYSAAFHKELVAVTEEKEMINKLL